MNSNQYVVTAIPTENGFEVPQPKHAIGLTASYRCAYELIEEEWLHRGVHYLPEELDAIRTFLDLKDQGKHSLALELYNKSCGGCIKIIIEQYKLPQFSINENCHGVKLREKIKEQ